MHSVFFGQAAMPKKLKVTRHSSSWFQIRSTLRRITMQTKDGVIFCLTHGSSKKTYKFLAGIVCLVRRSFYENELFPIVMTHRLSKKNCDLPCSFGGRTEGLLWEIGVVTGNDVGCSGDCRISRRHIAATSLEQRGVCIEREWKRNFVETFKEKIAPYSYTAPTDFLGGVPLDMGHSSTHWSLRSSNFVHFIWYISLVRHSCHESVFTNHKSPKDYFDNPPVNFIGSSPST